MKKVWLFASLLIVAGVAISSLLSQEAPAPDRPAGVAAGDWIPINDALGLQILRAPTSYPPTRAPSRAMGGQFMAKVNGVWVDVVLGPQPEGLRILPGR